MTDDNLDGVDEDIFFKQESPKKKDVFDRTAAIVAKAVLALKESGNSVCKIAYGLTCQRRHDARGFYLDCPVEMSPPRPATHCSCCTGLVSLEDAWSKAFDRYASVLINSHGRKTMLYAQTARMRASVYKWVCTQCSEKEVRWSGLEDGWHVHSQDLAFSYAVCKAVS